ncbi:MAG: hemerythrin domain-containing protein [Candidatus Eremiobacteraeota bacterium]|nr:hemerythrin domain-containing protein [Candidatus Eremiobacteraeota bacterium]
MNYTQSQTSSAQIPTVGNDAIEILVNDHQRIKQLLGQLTDGPQAQRTSTLEALKETLTVHNATEENLIYPAIREIAGRKMHSSELYHETAEADVALWQLSMMSPTDDTFASTATKARDAIEKHISSEEESEFPHLRDSADTTQQQTLTSKVKQFRDRFH